VSLVYSAQVEPALPLAQTMAAWIRAQGREAKVAARDAFVLPDMVCDLVVVLGGDGSILRAMRQAAPLGVPLLGINLGRVGFLTEAPPEAWQDTLRRVLAGEGWIESRTMLRAALWRKGNCLAQDDALNDAVVSRGALARTVRLKTSVDGIPLTRYVTDGLIISTATGSTAYAYAVGGPILPPWLSNLVIIPAAPHLSLERPLVLDATATIDIEVATEMPGMLTLDGRVVGELLNGDMVHLERSPLKGRFLRLEGREAFYRTLVARLTPHHGD